MYFSHLEPMGGVRANLSHFLWTLVNYAPSVYDAPKSSSLNQDGRPIRIAC